MIALIASLILPQANPELVSKALDIHSRIYLAAHLEPKIPSNSSWRGYRSDPNERPYEAVEANGYGAFYFDPSGRLTLYSAKHLAPRKLSALTGGQAWIFGKRYMEAVGWNVPFRLRREPLVGPDTIVFELNAILGEFEAWEPGASFFMEVDSTTGQLLLFAAKQPIKPDPDLKHPVTIVQARTKMLEYLTQPFFGIETDLRLVHHRAGKSRGLGKWNEELEKKYRNFQATLCWRGEYRLSNNDVVELYVDCRTNELLELNTFNGGFGTSEVSSSNKFLWGIGPDTVTVQFGGQEVTVRDVSIELTRQKASPTPMRLYIKFGKTLIETAYDKKNGLIVARHNGAVGIPSPNLRKEIERLIR